MDQPRRDELAQQVEITPLQDDGWRYLLFHDLVIGRLRATDEGWQYSSLGGWIDSPGRLIQVGDEASDVERAELWAALEVVNLMTRLASGFKRD